MTASRIRRVLPITVVLLIAAVGLLLYAMDRWRKGSAMLGVAAFVGAVLRIVVPEGDAGVLAVRGRTFDVTFLLAVAALFAALVIWPE